MAGTFEDNFDRLLGLHRLTARKAAPLLGVSPATLSYWRNGRREPDRESLMRVSAFFLVDPWSLVMAPIREFLPLLVVPERFDWVEKRIAEGQSVEHLPIESLESIWSGVLDAAKVEALPKRVSPSQPKVRKLRPTRDEPSETS